LKERGERSAVPMVDPQPGRAIRRSPFRCAIYARRSASPDPERQRTSIELQRQTVGVFIASRRHEGWVALPERYEDMGFTGGNMERPALDRLLVEVEQGNVDCVVVYKLDRLTRSLVDFARLVDIFDAYGVAFACATQDIDTTHPMGRLALNVLLSFAQFERGIIADRIRDKMHARFRRGEWASGDAPLGYEVDRRARRLIPCDEEAERVRAIFGLYLEHRSTLRVVEELCRRGWRPKRRFTKNGVARPSVPFGSATVAYLLRSPVYIGKVRCKGEVYAGNHEPIVDETVWRRAQVLLRQNWDGGPRYQWNEYHMLLRGLLYCQACGAPMKTRSCAPARGLLYYVCCEPGRPPGTTCRARWVRVRTLDATVLKHIRECAAGPSCAAALPHARQRSMARVAELEERRQRLGEELLRLRKLVQPSPGASVPPRGGQKPAVVPQEDTEEQIAAVERMRTIREELVSSHREWSEEKSLAQALWVFDPGWDALKPQEQWHALSLLVERVDYDPRTGKVSVSYREPVSRFLCELAGVGEAAYGSER